MRKLILIEDLYIPANQPNRIDLSTFINNNNYRSYGKIPKVSGELHNHATYESQKFFDSIDNLNKRRKIARKKYKDIVRPIQKAIKETDSLEGFRELLEGYTKTSIFEYKIGSNKVPDPLQEKMKKKLGHKFEYVVMLQVISKGKIAVKNINWKLSEADQEEMLLEIWNRKATCCHCKTIVDLYRSGQLTSIEKDRVHSNLPYFDMEQTICCACTFCNQFFGNLKPKQRNALIQELREIFMIKGEEGVYDFESLFKALDILRHEYEKWADNGGDGKLKNNCTCEVQRILMDKKHILSKVFSSMKRSK